MGTPDFAGSKPGGTRATSACLTQRGAQGKTPARPADPHSRSAAPRVHATPSLLRTRARLDPPTRADLHHWRETGVHTRDGRLEWVPPGLHYLGGWVGGGWRGDTVTGTVARHAHRVTDPMTVRAPGYLAGCGQVLTATRHTRVQVMGNRTMMPPDQLIRDSAPGRLRVVIDEFPTTTVEMLHSDEQSARSRCQVPASSVVAASPTQVATQLPHASDYGRLCLSVPVLYIVRYCQKRPAASPHPPLHPQPQACKLDNPRKK